MFKLQILCNLPLNNKEKGLISIKNIVKYENDLPSYDYSSYKWLNIQQTTHEITYMYMNNTRL